MPGQQTPKNWESFCIVVPSCQVSNKHGLGGSFLHYRVLMPGQQQTWTRKMFLRCNEHPGSSCSCVWTKLAFGKNTKAQSLR